MNFRSNPRKVNIIIGHVQTKGRTLPRIHHKNKLFVTENSSISKEPCKTKESSMIDNMKKLYEKYNTGNDAEDIMSQIKGTSEELKNQIETIAHLKSLLFIHHKSVLGIRPKNSITDKLPPPESRKTWMTTANKRICFTKGMSSAIIIPNTKRTFKALNFT